MVRYFDQGQSGFACISLYFAFLSGISHIISLFDPFEEFKLNFHLNKLFLPTVKPRGGRGGYGPLNSLELNLLSNNPHFNLCKLFLPANPFLWGCSSIYLFLEQIIFAFLSLEPITCSWNNLISLFCLFQVIHMLVKRALCIFPGTCNYSTGKESSV